MDGKRILDDFECGDGRGEQDGAGYQLDIVGGSGEIENFGADVGG